MVRFGEQNHEMFLSKFVFLSCGDLCATRWAVHVIYAFRKNMRDWTVRVLVNVMLTLAWFSISACALHVQDPSSSSSNQTSSRFFNAPHFDLGNSSFHLSASLIAVSPESTGCVLNAAMRGRIVFEEPYFCSPEHKILECQ